MSSPIPHLTTAVVGAGLSGLVCARILQQAGRAVTVYEADASAAVRRQGGSLDIHTGTGQVALERAGLLERFREHVHVGGEATRVMDKHARVSVDEVERDGGRGRPEIDRTVLRQLLLDSLEPGTVAWGSKVVAARAAGSAHELELADGSTVHADLVVGADGAWSKVRALLTPVRPEYTGITLVEIRLGNAEVEHPGALAVTGRGSLFALSDGKYIGGHGGDQTVLACGLRVPEDWVSTNGIAWDDPAAVREALLHEYEDWAEPLKDLIRDCDDEIWPRPVYALPTGHRWERSAGVTLVGDAAHLMSPFAGEGANLALIDGADLATAVLAHDDLEAALSAYERKMTTRGARASWMSATSLRMMFTDGPPRLFVGLFTTLVLLSRLTRPLERLAAGVTSRS